MILKLRKLALEHVKFWITPTDETIKSNVAVTSKSKETKKNISEEDFRNRTFEIYPKNGNSSFEQDNWFRAERELRGFYK